MQIDELIERVKGLTGPDRETDAEILILDVPRCADLLPHWSPEEREQIIPRYTASLDAAVTLVERRDPERAVEHLKSAIEQVVKSNLSLADLPRFVIISLLTGVQNNEG